MQMTDLIALKRDGKTLTEPQLAFFINGFVAGDIPDYQAAAMLMAIYLKGMTAKETAILTQLMMASGDQLDLSAIKGIKVDKHSTGGVGDKTTLIVAPLVASLGIPVAKMSGKGLGHTGGTVDKLQSFRGLNVELDQATFIKQVNKIGIAVSGQSANLVPADKKLYALRDVTATVDHTSLIASSIMSKKLASGTDAIVLDIKVGNGAFISNISTARKLGKAMIKIGKQMDRQVVGVISRMEQPLGRAVGNSLEVIESIETLKGNGPKDLVSLSLELASQMVLLSGHTTSKQKALRLLKKQLSSGAALAKFTEFIKVQGGDVKQIKNYKLLPTAKYQQNVLAAATGYVESLHALTVGLASMQLGAGRQKKEDEIDLGAGIYLHKKTGDRVKAGEVLATLYTNKAKQLDLVAELVITAWKIGKQKPGKEGIVMEVIGN